jgi:hypothetical protein
VIWSCGVVVVFAQPGTEAPGHCRQFDGLVCVRRAAWSNARIPLASPASRHMAVIAALSFCSIIGGVSSCSDSDITVRRTCR